MLKSHIQETLEACLTEDENVTLADGFETAFIGVARQFDRAFAVYDMTKCLAVLIDQGMDLESAQEYMSFNVTGAWVGDHTPAFMTPAPDDWEIEKAKTLVAISRKLAFFDTVLRLLLPYVSPAMAKTEEERDMCLELLNSARLLTKEMEETEVAE